MKMNHAVIEEEFYGRDILSAGKLSRDGLLQLYSFAERMRPYARREVRTQVLGGYEMGSFFFKESTRTRLSSEAAFHRLGGNVITFIDPKFSSIVKGETFEDTIRTVDSYCDIMTIRFEEEGQEIVAAEIAEHPVVNGGAGSGEHPTQGLLDGYTLKEGAEKVGIDILREPFRIALIGDLKKGRTMHSLVPTLLTLCDKVSFHFVAPNFLQMPPKIIKLAEDRAAQVTLTDNLIEGVTGVDAVYIGRPQLERMSDEERAQWRACEDQYCINRALIETHCKPHILITHPLPRNKEIATDVDSMPNALYPRRQIENGVVIRMALYVFILGKNKKFP